MKKYLLFLILVTLFNYNISISGSKDFFISAPSSPGTTELAASFMKTLSNLIEKLAGFNEGSMKGIYLPTYKEAFNFIENEKPGFAMVSVGLYLEIEKKYKAKPFLQAAINGKDTDMFYVVTKGNFEKLDDLQGKQVTSNHLAEPDFVFKVIFEKNISSDFFKWTFSNRPLEIIKGVSKGEIDGTILNQEQFQNLEKLPFGKELKSIFSSKPIPFPPVIYFENNITKDEILLIKKAILNMENDSEGKELLKTMGITGFKEINSQVYDNVRKLYETQ